VPIQSSGRADSFGIGIGQRGDEFWRWCLSRHDADGLRGALSS